ncbi:4Fe-4S binding protein [bacterium]|nr:4Fe-4S binding protein [bacterium]
MITRFYCSWSCNMGFITEMAK